MNKGFLLVSLLFLFKSGFAQGKLTTISGEAPDYAGYSIELYQLADPISEEKEIITTLNIRDDGSFHSEFELDETTFVQAEFDAWQAQIYLEAGETYNFVFPPLNQVSDVQRRNPFFSLEPIYFGLKNAPETDLNRMIQSFDQRYSAEENKYFNKIYYTKSSEAVDSLKSNLEEHFPLTDNLFFEDYKTYKIAFAEYALHQGKDENFIKTYFVDKEPNLQLEPCQQLFEQLFTNYFTITANSIGGSDFKQLVGYSDLTGIESYIITENNWNKRLTHLVILSSIKDAYKQGQFPQNSLIKLLDKIAESNWDASEKRIASLLKEKLTYLAEGTNAPSISFTDFNGKEHSLDDFKGQYVYLHFTSVSNPICRQHLDYIKTDMSSYSSQIKFIHLIPESEASKKELIQQQEWLGDFYIVSEDETNKYDVQTYPTAFLISKEGKLTFSPASNPMDGFDRQFTSLLKQQHLEELRNQAK